MSEEWDVTERDDGTVRFDAPDRRAKVICKEASTLSGDVWNCRLFEADHPYGSGEPTSARVSLTRDRLREAVRQLDAERE